MNHCSDRAILLIVTEEDGDKDYYLKFESHFSWPGGVSGPTVGIGYDCGYSNIAQIAIDWTDYIGEERAQVLQGAAGRKGEAARIWTNANKRRITITWDEAIAQFKGHELPKWEKITLDHLPNCASLSGDSFGALVSLTYNRGPSYLNSEPRYTEMRNIRAHMEAKDFAAIPAEFLSMRRLWPVGGGLWKRRGHEALLFRDGLMAALPVDPSPPPSV